MDKKNKGLVDDNEHGIILNESGTSVSFGWDAGDENKDSNSPAPQEDDEKDEDTSSNDTDSRLIS